MVTVFLLRSARRGLFVCLLLCAVMCAQAASLASEHAHGSFSQHCCPLCHVGPLPFVQPVIAAALLPVLRVAWLECSFEPGSAHEVLLAAGSSRAPPA
ncbi:MAG: hypothetical protein ABSH05_24850 [Bryobacteraceae bacterium]|jgi:hypothetical protein